MHRLPGRLQRHLRVREWILVRLPERVSECVAVGESVAVAFSISKPEPIGVAECESFPFPQRIAFAFAFREPKRIAGVQSEWQLLQWISMIPESPSLGILISTHGAAPYVHLHLESLRRFGNTHRVVIHNDADAAGVEVRALCREYGAEYITPSSRLGHCAGDMAAFIVGLDWARRAGVDLLVKFSRRWVPLIPWQEELKLLAFQAQHATYSAHCAYHGFGFRTECMAMHVESWHRHNALVPMRHAIISSLATRPLVEAIVHRAALRIPPTAATLEWDAQHPPDPNTGGFAKWPLLGESRVGHRADVLWHEWAQPREYFEALRRWDIHYDEGRFFHARPVHEYR